MNLIKTTVDDPQQQQRRQLKKGEVTKFPERGINNEFQLNFIQFYSENAEKEDEAGSATTTTSPDDFHEIYILHKTNEIPSKSADRGTESRAEQIEREKAKIYISTV